MQPTTSQTSDTSQAVNMLPATNATPAANMTPAANNQQIDIEIIFTFNKGNQQMYSVKVDKSIQEKEFVMRSLNILSVDDVKNLAKISTSQIANDEKECIQYLIKRNGKYYFNPNSTDKDTKGSTAYKERYIQQRIEYEAEKVKNKRKKVSEEPSEN